MRHFSYDHAYQLSALRLNTYRVAVAIERKIFDISEFPVATPVQRTPLLERQFFGFETLVLGQLENENKQPDNTCSQTERWGVFCAFAHSSIATLQKDDMLQRRTVGESQRLSLNTPTRPLPRIQGAQRLVRLLVCLECWSSVYIA
jgi:hypothetical protein